MFSQNTKLKDQLTEIIIFKNHLVRLENPRIIANMFSSHPDLNNFIPNDY